MYCLIGVQIKPPFPLNKIFIRELQPLYLDCTDNLSTQIWMQFTVIMDKILMELSEQSVTWKWLPHA